MQGQQLQEYFPQDWTGLTPDNALGAIYGREPQMATELTTLIRQVNFGANIESTINRIAKPKILKDDSDFRWTLQGDGRKNIPLAGASIAGTDVTASSKAGLAHSRFTLTFGEKLFSEYENIFGEKNEKYPIRTLTCTQNGVNYDYECEMVTGDPDLFIPYEEIIAGKRFSRGWGLVEKTLSKQGVTPSYTSPFSMKNVFSMIRMQDTRPGNMIKKPVAFSWVVINPATGKQEIKTTWMEYADWQFERQFQEMKNKIILYSTINRADDGTFKNKGLSGFTLEQGAGIFQQMSSSNEAFYTDFDIKWLTRYLMDLTVGFVSGDKKEILLTTGAWGELQFHEALENYASLYKPLNDSSRVVMDKTGAMTYKGIFKRFEGPNNTIVNLMVDPTHDDPERNKIMHPSGEGLAESRAYNIYNIGTTEGEPNIQICYAGGEEDIRGYEKGLRDPFSLDSKNEVMSNGVDGYTIHRGSVLGAMIIDPTKTGRLVPNILA